MEQKQRYKHQIYIYLPEGAATEETSKRRTPQPCHENTAQIFAALPPHTKSYPYKYFNAHYNKSSINSPVSNHNIVIFRYEY